MVVSDAMLLNRVGVLQYSSIVCESDLVSPSGPRPAENAQHGLKCSRRVHNEFPDITTKVLCQNPNALAAGNRRMKTQFQPGRRECISGVEEAAMLPDVLEVP